MCKEIMENAIPEEREIVVQTAGQNSASQRFVLPDVAFVQASNYLAYETRYKSVVVSANMMAA
jgi:hypothetical protein